MLVRRSTYEKERVARIAAEVDAAGLRSKVEVLEKMLVEKEDERKKWVDKFLTGVQFAPIFERDGTLPPPSGKDAEPIPNSNNVNDFVRNAQGEEDKAFAEGRKEVHKLVLEELEREALEPKESVQ